MIDISRLSSRFSVRKLGDADAKEILALCRANTQFYRYCGAEATMEQVLHDLHVTPPGMDLSSKYYVGFYWKETLVAVMDFIDGYPEPSTVFIGFFMMNKALQGRQIGSAIIRETAAHLKSVGKTKIRLAIDEANPQSNHFWKKHGFVVVQKAHRDGWTLLVAEKTL